MQFYPDGWEEKTESSGWMLENIFSGVGPATFYDSWGQTCKLCLMRPQHLVFTLRSDAATAEKADITMATLEYLKLWDRQTETATSSR